jgi:hypothetical protein
MKLRHVLGNAEAGYHHYCPGCEEEHYIPTAYIGRSGPVWSFDGNCEVPTFNPSVRITYSGSDASTTDEDGYKAPPACCHYFLHAGQLNYCADSTHALAGQTVPLPDIPEKDMWE